MTRRGEPNRAIPNERREAIVRARLRNPDMTIVDLAARFDVSPTTVARTLSEWAPREEKDWPAPGFYAPAAKRLGIGPEEYRGMLMDGLRWCWECAVWRPAEEVENGRCTTVAHSRRKAG